jgi:hypothetical protein
MTDIARTIQTGSGMVQNQFSQLNSQMQSNTYTAMQVEAFKRQKQQRIDMIADATLATVGASQKKVSKSRKVLDDLQEAYGSLPAIQEGAQRAPEQQAIIEAYDQARTLYDAAVVERNTLIEAVGTNPRILMALDASSFYNKDIGDQVFNPEILDSMTPQQRDKVVTQLTALHQAKQERSAMQEAYEKEAGKLEAQRQYGTLQPAEEDRTPPAASVLSQIQYETNFTNWNLKQPTLDKYYREDLAEFYPYYQQMRDLPQGDKQVLKQVFDLWSPDMNQDYEAQDNYAIGYADRINEVIGGMNTEGLQPITLDIISKLTEMSGRQDAGLDARRIGAVINQIKNITRPVETSSSTLRPRNLLTAESR